MPDIDELKDGYNRRIRMRMISISLTLPLFWFITMGLLDLFAGTSHVPAHPSSEYALATDQPTQTTFLSQIGRMKDTLYTVDESILEIRLDKQRVYHHRRDSATIEYKISTGTERLEKGIKTRKGVFMVQNKIDWLYSVQFDSTKVFNWLGFNWGVGFHSLLGRRYYRYLGKRPTSHGCVRLSREDAKVIFGIVGVGTPVLVHEGDAARVVAFLPDSSIIDTTQYSSEEVHSIYSARLRDLYAGNRLFRNYPIVPMDRKYLGHGGVPIGSLDRVPDRQKVPPISKSFYSCNAVTTRIPGPKLKRWVEKATAMDKEKFEQTILP
jgi:L,D-transpeptidase-like protein